YAVTGDIVDMNLGEVVTFSPSSVLPVVPSTWYIGAKPALVEAGRDIVDSGTPAAVGASDFTSVVFGFFLNLEPTDVSLLQAGRDISYSSFEVAGPGTLAVTAGENFFAPTASSFGYSATTAAGALVSLGPVIDVNAENRQSGANIA